MTPKQEAFVREYLIDLNATQAAIRAGYSVRTAQEQASRLLSNVIVKAAVAEAVQARGKRLDVSADDVLREITRLAMVDPAAFLKVRKLADIAKLPEDDRRAIVGWSWDKHGQLVLKLAKEGALQMLGRHHRLFNDKVVVEVIDRANALQKARERAKGRA